MALGLGSDIIEVSRIQANIDEHGSRFLDRLFTQNEQEYCNRHRDAVRHYAGRFAAKEAIVKCFGKGVSAEIAWLDIEILNDEHGKPHASFSDKVKHIFNTPTIEVTISHCKEYAMAVALWVS